jgi:hypothetical protein
MAIVGGHRGRSKSRRRRPTTEPILWLQTKVFPFVWGEKVGDAVYPSQRKGTLIGRYNWRRFGYVLPNYKLQDHFEGRTTLYFWASADPATAFILVLLDVDVQKKLRRGSPEGALDFVAHLRQRWPTLYSEPSTGGLGQHAYLLVRKPGKDAATVKAALRHLERWLRQESVGFDVELVEVKGAPPLIQTDTSGHVEAVTFGSFAKLPRQVGRFAEWQKTTALSIKETLALQVNPQKAAAVAGPRTGRPRSSLDAGSVSGRLIGADELALLPVWERFFEQAQEHNPLLGGRRAVTATDFACAVCLLLYFVVNPKADRSLPQRRAEGLWKALHAAGDFGRPWNRHRWKAIRDWLTQRGWLRWQDRSFKVGTRENPGVAMKWCLSPWFVEALLRAVLEGPLPAQDTNHPPQHQRRIFRGHSKISEISLNEERA